MPHTFRAARLIGRPVLVAETHARLMVDLGERSRPLPSTALRQEDGLARRMMARLSALVSPAERRSPESAATGEDPDSVSDVRLALTDPSQIGAWYGAPPCAPDAERQPGGWFLEGPIAIIDIDGPLWDRGYGWGDGYDDIAQALRAARADDRVEKIFIRISSPGGLVDGLFDLVTEISAGSARQGGKPVTAFVAGAAYSAAYAIAAACDTIVCSPEGDVGSIGAVLLHVNEAGALAEHGVEITAIEFPDGKTDASWFKALTDSARADLDARIKRAALLFIDHVAAHRPLDAAAIIALKARIFSADDPDDVGRSALALGLIDSIAFERDAFAALAQTAGDTPAAPAPNAAAAAAASPAASASAAAASTPEETSRPTPKEADTMSTGTNLAQLQARANAGDAEAKKQLAAINAILASETPGEDDPAAGQPENEDPANAAAPEGEDPDPEAETENEDPDGEATMSGAEVVTLMTSKEAKGRQALAGVLAGTPGMTLKAAKKALAAAPAGRTRTAPPDPKLTEGGPGASATGRVGNADADEALSALSALRGSRVLRDRSAAH